MQGEADGGAQTKALREKSGSAMEERRFWREWGAKLAAFKGQAYLEEEGSGRLLGRQECTL